MCAPLTLYEHSAQDKYTFRHWSDSLYRRIGEVGYGNIKQWIHYFPQILFTSSTRPAVDTDSGQIFACSGTSLNYDKVRRRIFPWTNNASDTNDIVYHHCNVETRPTRVPCALTTIFVMAGRQGLTCTRLHKNKLIVMKVYQQQSPRYLSISTEAWAVKAKGNYV